jgi:RNA polymerase sigma-70 factor (ECF subfamily)
MSGESAGVEAAEDRVRALLDAGDLNGAATEIIRAYGPRILRYFHSLLRDEDAAGDAFALFGEQVWKGIGRFKGESPALTWSYQVAWSAAGRLFRDPYRRRRRRLDTAAVAELVDEVRKTTLPHLRTEVKAGMARLRESLEPEDRTLLYLRIDQGMSWKAVAQVLCADGRVVEEPSLRKRFERIKDRLRRIAKEEGLLEG